VRINKKKKQKIELDDELYLQIVRFLGTDDLTEIQRFIDAAIKKMREEERSGEKK
tara:strand:+ start:12338 stop:12502 length:165 start_codon:yes stop_codon:yes gene_type:complete